MLQVRIYKLRLFAVRHNQRVFCHNGATMARIFHSLILSQDPSGYRVVYKVYKHGILGTHLEGVSPTLRLDKCTTLTYCSDRGRTPESLRCTAFYTA